MPVLSLNGIVDVSISISPETIYRETFDAALILGSKVLIPTATRVIEFFSLAEVVEYGFVPADEEYKAASIYFSQNPMPSHLFIGVKQAAESLTAALTACRVANFNWYVAIPCEALIEAAADSDLTTLATYVESVYPETLLALSLTKSATYLATLNVLKTAKYKRTISQYINTTDQVSNDSLTGISGIIGYAMGKNKPNVSAFNLAYKSVAGLAADTTITSAALSTLLAANGNIFVNQGYYYNLFRQGKMSSGDYFDEVINIDMMVNDLKVAVMEKLQTADKIPQTDNGVNILTAGISEALDTYVNSGFIAEGKWLGQNILSLKTGDTLSGGYLIQFESVASQSSADRAARIAPTCYIAIKFAGAIEHVVIALSASK